MTMVDDAKPKKAPIIPEFERQIAELGNSLNHFDLRYGSTGRGPRLMLDALQGLKEGLEVLKIEYGEEV